MIKVVISCEHATNKVPTFVKKHIALDKKLLESHRGYDIGALSLTRSIAKLFHEEPFLGEISRLVIDLNRSLYSKTLHYEMVQLLPQDILDKIKNIYYVSYRERVRRKIASAIAKHKTVVHLSIHSFTPVLHGKIREVDLGFLYDPKRALEVAFCKNMKSKFCIESDAICRMNQPYKGTADGFVTSLRREFSQDLYIGIEIEMNQKFTLYDKPFYGKKILKPLLKSLSSSFL